MEKSINTKLPIRFYDDRNKDQSEVRLEKILFEDDKTCLCTISIDGDKDGIDEEFKKVLFNKENGEVLTDNFPFWIAENYETEQDRKTAELAVTFVRKKYVTRDGAYCLVISDVADLIEKMTGVKVKQSSLVG